jgi:hypothetical protein
LPIATRCRIAAMIFSAPAPRAAARAAARAAPQVDVEHALEQPRPADGLRPGLHGKRVAADLACGAASRFARRVASRERVDLAPGVDER